jgi:hypothetical protein
LVAWNNTNPATSTGFQAYNFDSGPWMTGSGSVGAFRLTGTPVVNDLVTLTSLTTAFDPMPVTGGPAGTLRITAEFLNTSSQAIGLLFAQVAELSGDNLLLNADHVPGGTGSRLTPSGTAGTALTPGSARTFGFVIGLGRQEPFTFSVNLLGEH